MTYVKGIYQSNDCGNGKKIVNSIDCEAAGRSLGLRIGDLNENSRDWTGYCYELEGYTYFNKQSGIATEMASPICVKGKSPSYH